VRTSGTGDWNIAAGRRKYFRQNFNHEYGVNFAHDYTVYVVERDVVCHRVGLRRKSAVYIECTTSRISMRYD